MEIMSNFSSTAYTVDFLWIGSVQSGTKTPQKGRFRADVSGSLPAAAVACLAALTAGLRRLAAIIGKVSRVGCLSLASATFACNLALLFSIHRGESPFARLCHTISINWIIDGGYPSGCSSGFRDSRGRPWRRFRGVSPCSLPQSRVSTYRYLVRFVPYIAVLRNRLTCRPPRGACYIVHREVVVKPTGFFSNRACGLEGATVRAGARQPRDLRAL